MPQRRTDAETHLVERGKPREQVTQTLVGALHDGNELIMEIDDYHRFRIPEPNDVRNVAYRGLYSRIDQGVIPGLFS